MTHKAPQPDSRGTIDLAGYIANDAATDNTPRLLALRDVLHEHRDRPLTLRFPAGGEVHYTDNRWLWGVGDVTIQGDGTGFRCTSTSAWDADTRPFNVKTPFHILGPISRAEENRRGNPFTVGALVLASALKGATRIEVAEPEQYVGRRVLIYGYDMQQGGFPPNPRFFHFTRGSAVGGRGLEIADPLPFALCTDWPDFDQFTGPIGRPRILSLERSDYHHPRRIRLRGVRWLPGLDGGVGAGASSLCADILELEDCEGDYCTFGIARTVMMTRVSAREWEPDKIIGELKLDGCRALEGFSEATGVRRLSARNCVFGGDIRPRGPEMEFTDCRFVGLPEHTFGIWRYIDRYAVARLCFVGCTFDATASPDLRYAINPSADDTQPALLPMIEVIEVLPEAVAVRAVGRWEGQDVDLWANMLAGQPLLDASGVSRGVVDELRSDAGGRVLVRATWDQPPQVGAVYQMWLIFGRFDGGGNKVIGRDVPLWRGKFESGRTKSTGASDPR